jgi:hypothetical protein
VDNHHVHIQTLNYIKRLAYCRLGTHVKKSNKGKERCKKAVYYIDPPSRIHGIRILLCIFYWYKRKQLWCLLHASLVIADKHLKLGRTLLGLINMHVQKMAYIALHNYLHMTFFFFFTWVSRLAYAYLD